MRKIEDLAADIFKCKVDELFTPTRKREVVDARKACMMIMADNSRMTLSVIGRYFLQDHATVTHAIKRGRELYKIDKYFQAAVDALRDFYNSGKIAIPFDRSEAVYSVIDIDEEEMTLIKIIEG